MTDLPAFDVALFSDSTQIDNPYFSLPAGTIHSYGAASGNPKTGETETQRNDQFATFERRLIGGIETIVVRDSAYENGRLVEDTLDWYAQDDLGNVWYLGEIATNFRYGQEGGFISQDHDGSWLAGMDGARPGWIMEAVPVPGDAYYQEFYQTYAEDEGAVVATGVDVAVDFGAFPQTVKILDTSALDAVNGAFKYYAPGIGMVLEEEIALARPDHTELRVELQAIREIAEPGAADPTNLGIAGDGASLTITFLGEFDKGSRAIGAYTFDSRSGEMGEARILFSNVETLDPGRTVELAVGEGRSLGLFLIPDAQRTGIDLEGFARGGLFFANLQSGDIAGLFDSDPSTAYNPEVASIFDGLSPVLQDGDGVILPLQAVHAVGNRNGINLLNHVAGQNARLGHGLPDVPVITFEAGLAGTPAYDGDFDDALVAISRMPLSEAELARLLEQARPGL